MKKGYSEEEIFAGLVESDQDRKRRRVLAKITETVEARRLQKRGDLLTLEKRATWRRMNGFDRVTDARIIGVMIFVRSHPLRRNTPLICGPR